MELNLQQYRCENPKSFIVENSLPLFSAVVHVWLLIAGISMFSKEKKILIFFCKAKLGAFEKNQKKRLLVLLRPVCSSACIRATVTGRTVDEISYFGLFTKICLVKIRPK
jgi:hypothetical protein